MRADRAKWFDAAAQEYSDRAKELRGTATQLDNWDLYASSSASEPYHDQWPGDGVFARAMQFM
jgi:hypothetical protein